LKEKLLLFYRNPELGKVKTRLAKTLGDKKALEIYLQLAAHTKSITQNILIKKIVCYSNFIDEQDNWPASQYQKKLQHGTDLGEKMSNAFAEEFEKKSSSICIIGTDCFELTTEIIKDAFQKLETHDAVLGPAHDGGYYLLGTNKFIPELLQNKQWSTSSVAEDTIQDFQKLKLTYAILPTLTDVDEEKDLPINFRLE
jgi:uncharacterized protein